MSKGLKEFHEHKEKLDNQSEVAEQNIINCKNLVISSANAVKKAEEKLYAAQIIDKNGQPMGDISAALRELDFTRQVLETHKRALDIAKAELETIKEGKRSLIDQINEYNNAEKKNLTRLRILEHLEFGELAQPFFDDIVQRINQAEEMKADLYQSMGLRYSPKYYTGNMIVHNTGGKHEGVSNNIEPSVSDIYQAGDIKSNFIETNVNQITLNSTFSNDIKRNNALRTADKEKVDAILRPICGKVWKSLDDETKTALYDYTGDAYKDINKFLAGEQIEGDLQRTRNQIERITNAIDKSELPMDMWLSRGINEDTAIKMFEDLNINNIQKKIRKKWMVRNDPFMSCGAAMGSGFNSSILLNIYAPKGTKAIYLEPISQHGNNWKKKNWDGESEQSSYSPEFEVLIQKGTRLRPTAVRQDGQQLIIDVEIVGQF